MGLQNGNFFQNCIVYNFKFENLDAKKKTYCFNAMLSCHNFCFYFLTFKYFILADPSTFIDCSVSLDESSSFNQSLPEFNYMANNAGGHSIFNSCDYDQSISNKQRRNKLENPLSTFKFNII